MGGASGIWRRREAWRIVGPILAVGVTATSAHAQCQYDVTIIQAPVCPGPLPEPPATFATGLNELGHVVGYYDQCEASPFNEAFLWTPKSGMVTVQRPGGILGATATDTNDAGQIIGTAEISGIGRRGFLIDEGVFIDLGTLQGGNFSDALAINNQRQIVGYWGNDLIGDPTSTEAFVWQNDVMTGLGPDLGLPKSRARDINDAEQVTGFMGTSLTSDISAFIWSEGAVIDVGPIPGGFTSDGISINNLAQVVISGRIERDTGFLVRSFLWDNGQLTDLGLLPSLDRCFASDVNDVGQVVGVCDESSNPNNDVPFMWQGGVMSALSGLIADDGGLQLLRSVNSINNSGQITGWGIGPDGHVVAVLLTPVDPSPGDVNGDCRTDVVDLIILLNAWGQIGVTPADLNNDGVVNVLDLIILLLSFGG